MLCEQEIHSRVLQGSVEWLHCARSATYSAHVNSVNAVGNIGRHVSDNILDIRPDRVKWVLVCISKCTSKRISKLHLD